jgi:hypothetical protein
MPEVRCSLGQDGTEAPVQIPIILTPVTGDFGSDEGTITLISNDNRQRDSMDLVGPWLPHALAAKFHTKSRGTGSDSERFSHRGQPE